MSLDVRLHGEGVATLRRCDGGYTLVYDEEAVERLGPERAQVSFALPPQAEPHEPAAPRAYVEGLPYRLGG